MNVSKCICGFLIATMVGCQSFTAPSFAMMKMSDWNLFRAQNSNDNDDFESAIRTKMIGQHTTVAGLNVIMLQGVGLVTGLNGTGGDPPPSLFRTALLKEMRKRKVPQPNQLLRSPNTAMVVVRAYLPPLVRKRDRFDVQVRIPSNSNATSLSGGILLESLLSEQAIVPGRGVMKGHIFAKAAGPILISTSEGDKESLAGVVRRGSVLGGGFSLKDRDMALYLRNDFKSIRNAKRIAEKIGKRFYQYNKSNIREPLAEAKTNQRIVLKIKDRYRDNYPRYLQVIRNIPFRETRIAQRVRMQKLKKNLNNPPLAERAAIQLEAIGADSIPILNAALKHENIEVRFHAAVALAYLGEATGLPTLAEAARDEPAFRVFAFAAMATIEDADSNILLRKLMDEKSPETRYGAVRALTTLDKNSPFIRGEKMKDQFRLRVLDTKGPPLVHLTRHRKAEIVLFGANQRFSTPLAIRAGRSILITASPQSDHVIVSRFNAGKRKIVSTRVADVIRTAAEFGATYPEVAAMLNQAHQQKHLPGLLEIDALPEAGRVYYRNRKPNSLDPTTEKKRKTRIGQSSMAPNLFSTGKPKKKKRSETGTASLTDISEKEEADQDEKTTSKQPWYDPFGIFHAKPEEEFEKVASSENKDER
jgi:flagellar basal body P-ring protein FlgI